MRKVLWCMFVYVDVGSWARFFFYINIHVSSLYVCRVCVCALYLYLYIKKSVRFIYIVCACVH